MWNNFEFKMWLKDIDVSGISQEKLKLEAMKFSCASFQIKNSTERTMVKFREGYTFMWILMLQINFKDFPQKVHF